VSSSHVVFTSSSSVIKPLVTDVLTLRCDLRDGATTSVVGKRHAVSEVSSSEGQSMSEGQETSNLTPRGANDVSSLVISKNGVRVASITQRTPARALTQTPGLTVTGQIPGTGAEKGFLEVSFKYPGPDQSGRYQCTVTGTGRAQTFTQNLAISDVSTSQSDVISYIRQLQITNDLHTATIASLKQELTEVKQKQNTAVVFTASLDHQVAVPSGQVVIFNHVITNEGQGYDNTSGVFTCPVSGFYQFDVHIQGQLDLISQVEIRHNQDVHTMAYAEDRYDNQAASASVCILVNKGDTVKITAGVYKSWLDGGNHEYCSFSGHLISAL